MIIFLGDFMMFLEIEPWPVRFGRFCAELNLIQGPPFQGTGWNPPGLDKRPCAAGPGTVGGRGGEAAKVTKFWLDRPDLKKSNKKVIYCKGGVPDLFYINLAIKWKRVYFELCAILP
jgi:hypothetical protein